MRKSSNHQAGLEPFCELTDQFPMRTEASFQEILERKIKAHSHGAPSSASYGQSLGPQDPAHLAYLMGSIGQAFFRPVASRAYPSRPKPPPPPHVLSPEQEAAAAYFTTLNTPLSPRFSERELKRAYRILALKLHPDMNKGASEDAFIQLKKNYETLNELFN